VHSRRVITLGTIASAVLVTALAWPLPPEGFVSGDQGVKLISSLNAVAHPALPTQVMLPRVEGAPAPYMDPFFTRHGDHAHALQSPLFPVITAPLVAIFGLRGAYVLPALAFVVLLPLVRGLVRATAPAVPLAAVACCTVLVSPVFFYAFEFWEHVPAIAVLAGASVLVTRAPHHPWAGPAVAGVLAGIAVLLRPEAIWYAAALGLLGGVSRRTLVYVSGSAMVLATFAALNVWEGGSPLGYHASANLAALSDRWALTRLERLTVWMLSPHPLFLAALVGLGVSYVVWWRRHSDLAVSVALASATILALGRLAGAYGADALWYAWPVGGLALVPVATSQGLRQLRWLAGATLMGVWLTSTHDGGAQWGPRILLIATPALVALAAVGLAEALRKGPTQTIRIGLVCVILTCGLWTSRAAYRGLRGAKQTYARVVRGIEAETPPGAYVLTNVWWLDQIAASLYGSRTFLVTSADAGPAQVLATLERAGVPSVSLAWSTEPGASGPMSTAGTCYSITATIDLPDRGLHVARADCERPVSR